MSDDKRKALEDIGWDADLDALRNGCSERLEDIYNMGEQAMDYELQGFEESDLEYHKRMLRIEEARAAFFRRESVMLFIQPAKKAELLDKARQAEERAAEHLTAVRFLSGGKGK